MRTSNLRNDVLKSEVRFLKSDITQKPFDLWSVLFTRLFNYTVTLHSASILVEINRNNGEPLARRFVSNFCTMLSYAVSSATPESLTSFSLMAMHMSFFASRSSSSSKAFEFPWNRRDKIDPRELQRYAGHDVASTFRKALWALHRWRQQLGISHRRRWIIQWKLGVWRRKRVNEWIR